MRCPGINGFIQNSNLPHIYIGDPKAVAVITIIRNKYQKESKKRKDILDWHVMQLYLYHRK